MLKRIAAVLVLGFLSPGVFAGDPVDNSAVMAALNEDLQALEYFLVEKPQLLEAEAQPERFAKQVEYTWIRLTPLLAAVTVGNQKIVEKLLQLGADPSHATVYTPLATAARRGHLAIAKLLLSQRVDVNQISGGGPRGETALYYATFDKHHQIVRLLLKWGADPDIATRSGQRPLMIAAADTDSSLCEFIVDGGADLNAVDDDAHSAMHYAVLNYRAEVVSYLLSLNVEINPLDEKKCRRGGLLHHLVEALSVPRSGMIWRYFTEARPAFAVARLLLDHGIDLDIKDRFGDTALDKANRHRQLYRTSNWMISNPLQNPVWTLHEMILQALSERSN